MNTVAAHLVVTTALLAVVLCLAEFAPDPSEPLAQVSKRPFCNAFTGCGRKRSDDAAAADAFIQRLGQQILRQAQMSTWNGKVRTPWVAGERKRRMASPLPPDSEFHRVIEQQNRATTFY